MKSHSLPPTTNSLRAHYHPPDTIKHPSWSPSSPITHCEPTTTCFQRAPLIMKPLHQYYPTACYPWSPFNAIYLPITPCIYHTCSQKLSRWKLKEQAMKKCKKNEQISEYRSGVSKVFHNHFRLTIILDMTIYSLHSFQSNSMWLLLWL